jgi:hypothetical protein
MTGTREFSNFVMPRLALGPSKQGPGNVGPDSSGADLNVLSNGAGTSQSLSSGRVMMNGVPDQRAPAAVEPDFAKVLKVAAGETTTLAVPVEAASRMGLTFVAASTVSATLLDDSGAVVGTNLTGTPGAGQTFRSMSVDRPVEPGTWTLTLQNTGETEREIVLSTWSLASSPADPVAGPA